MNNFAQQDEAVSFSKDIVALVFLAMIWLVATFAVEFGHITFLQGNNRLAQLILFFIGFGVAHWRYCKAISYLYNLNKRIIVFAPSVNVQTTKRLGQFFTFIGIIMLCILLLKA